MWGEELSQHLGAPPPTGRLVVGGFIVDWVPARP